MLIWKDDFCVKCIQREKPRLWISSKSKLDLVKYIGLKKAIKLNIKLYYIWWHLTNTRLGWFDEFKDYSNKLDWTAQWKDYSLVKLINIRVRFMNKDKVLIMFLMFLGIGVSHHHC